MIHSFNACPTHAGLWFPNRGSKLGQSRSEGYSQRAEIVICITGVSVPAGDPRDGGHLPLLGGGHAEVTLASRPGHLALVDT